MPWPANFPKRRWNIRDMQHWIDNDGWNINLAVSAEVDSLPQNNGHPGTITVRSSSSSPTSQTSSHTSVVTLLRSPPTAPGGQIVETFAGSQNNEQVGLNVEAPSLPSSQNLGETSGGSQVQITVPIPPPPSSQNDEQVELNVGPMSLPAPSSLPPSQNLGENSGNSQLQTVPTLPPLPSQNNEQIQVNPGPMPLSSSLAAPPNIEDCGDDEVQIVEQIPPPPLRSGVLENHDVSHPEITEPTPPPPLPPQSQSQNNQQIQLDQNPMSLTSPSNIVQTQNGSHLEPAEPTPPLPLPPPSTQAVGIFNVTQNEVMGQTPPPPPSSIIGENSDGPQTDQVQYVWLLVPASQLENQGCSQVEFLQLTPVVPQSSASSQIENFDSQNGLPVLTPPPPLSLPSSLTIGNQNGSQIQVTEPTPPPPPPPQSLPSSQTVENGNGSQMQSMELTPHSPPSLPSSQIIENQDVSQIQVTEPTPSPTQFLEVSSETVENGNSSQIQVTEPIPPPPQSLPSFQTVENGNGSQIQVSKPKPPPPQPSTSRVGGSNDNTQAQAGTVPTPASSAAVDPPQERRRSRRLKQRNQGAQGKGMNRIQRGRVNRPDATPVDPTNNPNTTTPSRTRRPRPTEAAPPTHAMMTRRRFRASIVPLPRFPTPERTISIPDSPPPELDSDDEIPNESGANQDIPIGQGESPEGEQMDTTEQRTQVETATENQILIPGSCHSATGSETQAAIITSAPENHISATGPSPSADRPEQHAATATTATENPISTQVPSHSATGPENQTGSQLSTPGSSHSATRAEEHTPTIATENASTSRPSHSATRPYRPCPLSRRARNPTVSSPVQSVGGAMQNVLQRHALPENIGIEMQFDEILECLRLLRNSSSQGRSGNSQTRRVFRKYCEGMEKMIFPNNPDNNGSGGNV